MSATTGIEWTDATWNPVTGCTKVSAGCDHCYAETFAERWRGTPGHYFERGFDVQARPDKLSLPLKWRKPKRIFVNSMSDLFHDDVHDDYIARVFAVMARCPQHTFQVLTKRHARMRSLLSSRKFSRFVEELTPSFSPLVGMWPLPNVWLGVSTENQQWADIRIPALLDTPAAVRFISAEPLLGPIDLRTAWIPSLPPTTVADARGLLRWSDNTRIDWVIVGGESGRQARPMHPDWARSLRDQCTAADVPFLFKQWGEFAPGMHEYGTRKGLVRRHWYPGELGDTSGNYESVTRVGKHRAGRELDGRTWDQYPAVAS